MDDVVYANSAGVSNFRFHQKTAIMSEDRSIIEAAYLRALNRQR
jgi:hypothetical protein